MSNERFLTSTEVTMLLGISYPTFIRMVKNKAIPSIKIGRQIRVPQSYFNKLEQEIKASFKREL